MADMAALLSSKILAVAYLWDTRLSDGLAGFRRRVRQEVAEILCRPQ